MDQISSPNGPANGENQPKESIPAIASLDGPKTENHKNEQSEGKYASSQPLKDSTFRERMWKSTRRPLTDWLITFATIAMAVTSYLQWDVIRSQLREMQSSSTQTEEIKKELGRIANTMENTSIENRKALSATIAENRKVLDQSIESSRLDQRAWVGGTEVIKPEIRADAGLIFGVRIGNSGKTPALKVQSRLRVLSAPSTTPFSPTFGTVPGIVSNTAMQPGMTAILFTSPMILNTRQLEQIKSGDRMLYLYGRIAYEDIFQKPHRSFFCVFLTKDTTAMQSCDTYNDAN